MLTGLTSIINNSTMNSLSLALTAIKFALVSLWRESRFAIIVRILFIVSIYALSTSVIKNGNLSASSTWTFVVAILGFTAMITSGLSIRFRKRRELMLPWLMSMPVRVGVWTQLDVIALVIATLVLAIPFLCLLCALDSLTYWSVVKLVSAQAVLIFILAKFCASSRFGEVGWTIAIMLIWILITVQFYHYP
jgi:hypothetical protein